MVNYCCVPRCRGSNGFTFPAKDLEQRQRWIEAVGRRGKDGQLWMPSTYSTVCKLHFRDSDFKELNAAGFPFQVHRLKDGVVPSIFGDYDKIPAPSPSPRRKRKARKDPNLDIRPDERGSRFRVDLI